MPMGQVLPQPGKIYLYPHNGAISIETVCKTLHMCLRTYISLAMCLPRSAVSIRRSEDENPPSLLPSSPSASSSSSSTTTSSSQSSRVVGARGHLCGGACIIPRGVGRVLRVEKRQFVFDILGMLRHRERACNCAHARFTGRHSNTCPKRKEAGKRSAGTPHLCCAVCLQPCEDNDAQQLHCGHRFHHHCIVRWLICSNNMSCPLCRDSMIDRVFEMRPGVPSTLRGEA